MRLGDLDALKEEVKALLDLAVKRVDDTPNTSPCYRTYVAQENERARLIDLIDNTPTVETDIEVVAKDAYEHGYTDGWKERFGEPNKRPLIELTDEVWKLYKKHQSHLATHVLEFGEELADLLGKYNEGGAE